VDYVEEIRRICDFKYNIYIIDKTIDELNNIIEKKKGKTKLNAKLAKIILTKKNINKINTKKDKIVDKLILEQANKQTLVATTDSLLKKKLKNKGISVIVLRQKSHLKLLD
jgi:rRNA-processing protein FCF1